MKTTVQARLDATEQRTLARLVRSLGWSPSRVVREGLRLLEASHPGVAPRRIAGLGQFCSGVRDRGSNRKHLKGFGR